jgi:hypothetical protein
VSIIEELTSQAPPGHCGIRASGVPVNGAVSSRNSPRLPADTGLSGSELSRRRCATKAELPTVIMSRPSYLGCCFRSGTNRLLPINAADLNDNSIV